MFTSTKTLQYHEEKYSSYAFICENYLNQLSELNEETVSDNPENAGWKASYDADAGIISYSYIGKSLPKKCWQKEVDSINHVTTWIYTSPSNKKIEQIEQGLVGTDGRVIFKFLDYENSYDFIRTQDLIEKGFSLCDAVLHPSFKNKFIQDEEVKKKLEKWIARIKEQFRKKILQECSLDPVRMQHDDNLQYFNKKLEKATALYNELIFAVAQEIQRVGRNAYMQNEIIAALDEAEKLSIMDHGRPAYIKIGKIRKDGKAILSAQFPQGKQTVPSSYAHRDLLSDVSSTKSMLGNHSIDFTAVCEGTNESHSDVSPASISITPLVEIIGHAAYVPNENRDELERIYYGYCAVRENIEQIVSNKLRDEKFSQQRKFKHSGSFDSVAISDSVEEAWHNRKSQDSIYDDSDTPLFGYSDHDDRPDHDAEEDSQDKNSRDLADTYNDGSMFGDDHDDTTPNDDDDHNEDTHDSSEIPSSPAVTPVVTRRRGNVLKSTIISRKKLDIFLASMMLLPTEQNHDSCVNDQLSENAMVLDMFRYNYDNDSYRMNLRGIDCRINIKFSYMNIPVNPNFYQCDTSSTTEFRRNYINIRGFHEYYFRIWHALNLKNVLMRAKKNETLLLATQMITMNLEENGTSKITERISTLLTDLGQAIQEKKDSLIDYYEECKKSLSQYTQILADLKKEQTKPNNKEKITELHEELKRKKERFEECRQEILVIEEELYDKYLAVYQARKKAFDLNKKDIDIIQHKLTTELKNADLYKELRNEYLLLQRFFRVLDMYYNETYLNNFYHFQVNYLLSLQQVGETIDGFCPNAQSQSGWLRVMLMAYAEFNQHYGYDPDMTDSEDKKNFNEHLFRAKQLSASLENSFGNTAIRVIDHADDSIKENKISTRLYTVAANLIKKAANSALWSNMSYKRAAAVAFIVGFVIGGIVVTVASSGAATIPYVFASLKVGALVGLGTLAATAIGSVYAAVATAGLAAYRFFSNLFSTSRAPIPRPVSPQPLKKPMSTTQITCKILPPPDPGESTMLHRLMWSNSFSVSNNEGSGVTPSPESAVESSTDTIDAKTGKFFLQGLLDLWKTERTITVVVDEHPERHSSSISAVLDDDSGSVTPDSESTSENGSPAKVRKSSI